MIINIHGFGGKGNNSKYKWLCENFPRHEIYSPNLYSEIPQVTLSHLLNRIASYLRNNPENPMGVYVVGNSLGGFFAKIINQVYPGVAAILVNPSLAPFLTLREHINGTARQAYLNLLARYAYDDEPKYGNYKRLHVIIGDSDERIDHQSITIPLLPKYVLKENLRVIQGGTHHMDMTPEIENIFKSVIDMPNGISDGDPRYIHYCGEKKLP